MAPPHIVYNNTKKEVIIWLGSQCPCGGDKMDENLLIKIFTNKRWSVDDDIHDCSLLDIHSDKYYVAGDYKVIYIDGVPIDDQRIGSDVLDFDRYI